MKVYSIALAALLALAACGSDSADGNYNQVASEDLIDEQVDSDAKTSIDSIAKATTDGKIVFPLPDTLTTLVEQKQPQAQVATLTDQAMISDRLQVDNPLFLRADFNGNNTLDYAVQVLQNDSIHITAFLDYTDQAREVQVASYPARQLNDRWYSVYQLRKAPQDSLVQDPRNQRQVLLPTDGISVVEEERTTLYLMQDGRFIPFDAKK
ncbi:hypothetical protein DXT99_08620 [Pontibacter diazotrophicus]|uniref:Lipoprotein n=1 Tax=Pontibacter diazotrophicus TaxID=1400979 RepID=A0A3D8LF43_9BACT|nr:hypothetical protein [Pontibacter diazotrophicus]RDV15542.1 hypothetical protein DXT99_08620 [Pontibacter diazotrophicus]